MNQKRIKLMTDSASDIPAELEQEYDIKITAIWSGWTLPRRNFMIF